MNFQILWNWFLEFAETMGEVWLWLNTPRDFSALGFEVHFTVLGLLLAGAITVGIIRAILGVLG